MSKLPSGGVLLDGGKESEGRGQGQSVGQSVLHDALLSGAGQRSTCLKPPPLSPPGKSGQSRASLGGPYLPLAGADSQDAVSLKVIQSDGWVEAALVHADRRAVTWTRGNCLSALPSLLSALTLLF